MEKEREKTNRLFFEALKAIKWICEHETEKFVD